MADIQKCIKELIEYGLSKGLVDVDDVVYTVNQLIDMFRLEDYEGDFSESVENSTIRPVHEILDDMLDYAIGEGLTEDTGGSKDLFDTRIMGLITPAPSAIRRIFSEKHANDPSSATDWFYGISRASNYIRDDRIAKDVKWKTETGYGALDITINLSKPEKDPRDIAKAAALGKVGKKAVLRDTESGTYPKCLLCMENEGYAGRADHPARQNLRLIPITLCGEQYYFQYSPYVYYNEHCIVLSKKHTPMKIDRDAFAKLIDFVCQFPHYMIGSNADLPIVGGSILTHDHFQGGNYEFPMVRAPYESMFGLGSHPDVRAGIVKWPLSVIRLDIDSSVPGAAEKLTDAADEVFTKWRTYSDPAAGIVAETDGVPHNTVTPIARMRGNDLELDIVLRNNITSEEHPMGVFHPYSEYHHIKRENIGLIEVMGLAVLPARLKPELMAVEEIIASWDGQDQAVLKACLERSDKTAHHTEWALGIAQSLFAEGHPDRARIHETLRQETGKVFAKALECSGVYKCTPEGRAAFARFIELLK